MPLPYKSSLFLSVKPTTSVALNLVSHIDREPCSLHSTAETTIHLPHNVNHTSVNLELLYPPLATDHPIFRLLFLRVQSCRCFSLVYCPKLGEWAR